MLDASMRYSAVGIEIVVALAIGFFVGRWLDTRFSLWPWMTLLFSLCGLGAAIKAILRVVRNVDMDKL
jgi:F0F1-type ATP synthase assembly protein I